MKTIQLRLKLNDLRRDTMLTPFSCMLVRQGRMKSYENVALRVIRGMAQFR
jgi:hypothetical protein